MTRAEPADEAYPYSDGCGCALAQFLVATGRAVHPNVSTHSWRELHADYRPIHEGLAMALLASPHTFGALVSRLEWTTPDAYLIEQVGMASGYEASGKPAEHPRVSTMRSRKLAEKSA